MIENDIFKRSKVDYSKLINYGFIKIENKYVYEKLFLNDMFKAVIIIDLNGNISSDVIDTSFDSSYLGIRVKDLNSYASKVKDNYLDILNDIKDKCFINNYFINDQSNRVCNYILNKYNVSPVFPWNISPGFGVFKNDKGKWFSIIMNIDLSKIDNGHGEVEIINLKLNNNLINEKLNNIGFYKAYHMNKKYWVSIILNDTVSDSELFSLIDISYDLVN